MNTKLDGRFIDNLGRVVMTVDGLSDLIVAGKDMMKMQYYDGKPQLNIILQMKN